MTLTDCHKDPVLEKAKNSLWKVQSLLDKLNYQAQKMRFPGKFVAIDKQTIAFKGQLKLKLRISYKAAFRES